MEEGSKEFQSKKEKFISDLKKSISKKPSPKEFFVTVYLCSWLGGDGGWPLIHNNALTAVAAAKGPRELL